ncbi:unnamed protein product [Urochloa humidicola]
MDEDGAPPPVPATPDPAPPPPEPKPPLVRQRPPVRVTSEFDSERRLFSHRFSCRVLDGLAKLRLRVSHGAGGGGIAWGPPDVALLARNFSVVVDPASRGAVLRGAADLAGSLRLRASHNTKEQQGEVSVTANLGDSPCKIELSSMVPPNGLVGDAGGSTKGVPLKAKVHFTLKVPQDNVQNYVVVFHVKRRWDF